MRRSTPPASPPFAHAAVRPGGQEAQLGAKLALQGRFLRVLGAPSAFRFRSPGVPGVGEPALLVFVRDAAELARRLTTIVPSASADRLTWVAYPKAHQLGTDLNRDRLAALLAGSDLRPVTQVALDATWSAMRFRPER